MVENHQETVVKVTAAFFSNGYDREPTGEVKWRAVALLPPEGLGSTHVRIAGSVIFAKPQRHSKTNKISKLLNKKEDMEGNLCLFLERKVADINQIIKLATKLKASACVVAAEPTERVTLPAIVLSDERMDRLICSDVKISFEPLLGGDHLDSKALKQDTAISLEESASPLKAQVRDIGSSRENIETKKAVTGPPLSVDAAEDTEHFSRGAHSQVLSNPGVEASVPSLIVIKTSADCSRPPKPGTDSCSETSSGCAKPNFDGARSASLLQPISNVSGVPENGPEPAKKVVTGPMLSVDLVKDTECLAREACSGGTPNPGLRISAPSSTAIAHSSYPPILVTESCPETSGCVNPGWDAVRPESLSQPTSNASGVSENGCKSTENAVTVPMLSTDTTEGIECFVCDASSKVLPNPGHKTIVPSSTVMRTSSHGSHPPKPVTESCPETSSGCVNPTLDAAMPESPSQPTSSASGVSENGCESTEDAVTVPLLSVDMTEDTKCFARETCSESSLNPGLKTSVSSLTHIKASSHGIHPPNSIAESCPDSAFGCANPGFDAVGPESPSQLTPDASGVSRSGCESDKNAVTVPLLPIDTTKGTECFACEVSSESPNPGLKSSVPSSTDFKVSAHGSHPTKPVAESCSGRSSGCVNPNLDAASPESPPQPTSNASGVSKDGSEPATVLDAPLRPTTYAEALSQNGFPTALRSEAPQKSTSYASAASQSGVRHDMTQKPKDYSLFSEVVDRTFTSFKAAFFKSKMQPELEQLLGKGRSWSEENSYFDWYKQALDLVRRAECEYPEMNARMELFAICHTIHCYMKEQQFQIDLLFLAFSTAVCAKLTSHLSHKDSRYKSFRESILACIRSFDPCNFSGPKLLNLCKVNPRSSPCAPLRAFLLDLLKNANSSGGVIKNLVLTNIIWILTFHCGENCNALFPALRTASTRDFFTSQRGILQTFLPEPSLWLLGLHLQDSIQALCGMCLTLSQESGKDLRVPPQFAQFMVQLIEDESSKTRRDTRQTFGHWKILVDTLRHIQFNGKDRTHRRKVISALVSHLSYHNCNRFVQIDNVFSTVRLDHRDSDLFREVILTSICNDLKRHRNNFDLVATMRDVTALLDLPVGKLLASKNGVESVSNLAIAAMRCRGSFRDKLKFIGILHRCFVAKQWAPEPDSFRAMLQDCIRDLTTQGNSLTVMLAAFEVAGDSSIFSLPGSEDCMVEWLTKTLVSGQAASEALCHPQGLIDLSIDHSKLVPSALMTRMLTELKEALSAVCRDLGQAVCLYTSFCMGNKTPSSQLEEIAEHVVVTSFRTWAPKSVTDVIGIGPEVLTNVFDCLRRPSRISSEMNECMDRLKVLIVDWHQRFDTGDIIQPELALVLHSYDPAIWKIMLRIADVKYPSQDELSAKLDEFKELKTSIWRSLVITFEDDPESATSQSAQSVLQGYNAAAENGSPLERLFTEYQWITVAHRDGLEAAVAKHCTNQSITLYMMRLDREFASSFRKDHEEELCIAAFFLRFPSILFRDALGFGSWGLLPADEFFKKVNQSKQVLQDLFKDEARFKHVKDALKIIAISSSNLHEEILALSDCPTFDIGEMDKEHFHIAAVLCEISEPLLRFVSCCCQFKFSFAESDPRFLELSEFASSIGHTDALSWNMCKCVDVARRVSGLLCSQGKEVAADFDIRAALMHHLPTLLLLGELSLCSDVWTFAREMQWLGKDGFKRFYQEHDNVHNFLLGGASFEMTVLNSLELSIRYISTIGALQRVTTVQEFLDRTTSLNTQTDKGAFNDLHVVQQNISSVREWFTVGIDDMAAIFGLFDRVCTTGEFYICELEQESGPSQFNGLGLRYQKDGGKNEDGKSATLEGDALVEFVQQLEFIQHETETESHRVRQFIDQYQALERASEKLVLMASVGLSEVDLCSFCFKLNENGLSDAEKLLMDSSEKWSKCDDWLKQLRSDHSLTLLFWMEELREMYACLAEAKSGLETADGNVLLDKLACLVSRTVPRSPLSEDAMFDAARSASASLQAGAKQSWVVHVSKFIETFHEEMGLPEEAQSRNSVKASKIVIHTLSCDEDLKRSAIIGLFEEIYQNRLPEEFEVLDGISPCTMQKISIFLERVLCFPSNTFVILNVHELAGEYQEKILSFLSRRDVASRGICLHCIQDTNTILHESTWVQGRSWDNHSFGSVTLHDDAGWFKKRITDQVHISIVSASGGTGGDVGTGKTRFIRDEMERMRSEEEAQIAAVNLHEGVTLSLLVKALVSKFPCRSQTNAVHFSFTADYRGNGKPWAEIINHFFVSLLVLRSVHDPMSASSFHLGKGQWHFFIELQQQGREAEQPMLCPFEWICQSIPILAYCGQIVAPPKEFLIDTETRRVCMYLRAYDNGTINRRFCRHKRLLFLLDESGSMEMEIDGTRSALAVATDNALRIFDSHVQVEDMIGLITFDHRFQIRVPLQQVSDERHKQVLRAQLNQAQNGRWGGTNMYTALAEALHCIGEADYESETWIVCLTDGESADSSTIIQDHLRSSPDNLHIIVIGVNLGGSLHGPMQDLCNKFKRSTPRNKGFFVDTEAQADAINDAFLQVASRIPVSETFELDGTLTDHECRRIVKKYLPNFIADDDMLLQKFWIQALYRRVKVFDENQDFNYNEKHDALGSSLMETMLYEVEQFLSEDQSNSWIGKNHHQLIYDFTNRTAPQFRLVCTAPELMDSATRAKYERLELPGFLIPSNQDLQQRSTLLRFLSQALNVPLPEALRCIDGSSFVLTLDFTMKLLSIHERIASHIPCIVEGETGVSKTALTKMYSILMNSSLHCEAAAATSRHLVGMEAKLTEMGKLESCDSQASSHDRLQHALAAAAESTMEDTTDFARQLFLLIQEACRSRGPIFQDPPSRFSGGSDGQTKVVSEYLSWFSQSAVEPTFFEINVHASLAERDVVDIFAKIRAAANKLMQSDALVVVFLDEVNTSSIMGLFKEVIIDHSICGDVLEDNIVFVAACNPARGRLAPEGFTQRENDLGKDWTSGHYQVTELPGSIAKLKWAYGSLNSDQEKEFIFRRIELLGKDRFSPHLTRSLTELVSTAQEAIRSFATECVLRRLKQETSDGETERDARLRARSTVSLRDIQRVFDLFHFFSYDFPITCNEAQRFRHAMLLTISVVYYLRLDCGSRAKFIAMIESLPTEMQQPGRLQDVLNAAMDNIISETEVPPGIALTRGLKENTFMTLVCSLSRTPLMIVGPPGSSKTLSVNIVSDNANGEESPSPFYRKYARLSMFHYQCSKASTSREVSSVFEKAIQRQMKFDTLKHKCVVFFDEAGLPEEEKESLKVLHYFLEGHMSAKSEVGFVAVTNHVLDAAKSNRCTMLLRQEPDEDELLSIARGVLFGANVDGYYSARQVQCGDIHLDPEEFASNLCRSYTHLLHDDGQFQWFELFFGLRDFIYFLKAIRHKSHMADMVLVLSLDKLLWALERNFNGTDRKKLSELAMVFLGPVMSSDKAATKAINDLLCHPMDVVQDAVMEGISTYSVSRKPRFKLVIDETEDDSIVRLLSINGILDLSNKSLYKLSNMPDGAEMEKLRLVSGVKFAALQGNLAVLSQTEPVHESFYDLFNQNFRSMKKRDGELSLYANIAVGGISRRSLVHPSFQCIVHVRKSELDALPAPFLNRFEKFRLTTRDVLDSGWRRLGGMTMVLQNVRARVEDLCLLLGGRGIFGWIKEQTLDSIFVDMLPSALVDCHNATNKLLEYTPPRTSSSFVEHLTMFSECYTSLSFSGDDIEQVIDTAKKYLPVEDADILESLVDGGVTSAASLKNAFCGIVSGQNVSNITRVAQVVVQMLLTRAVFFRLILLATPESIFAHRHSLPIEIIEEYFTRQEHFSLKVLISRMMSSPQFSEKSNLHIVHTRTDAVVHSLPTISRDQSALHESAHEKSKIVRDLIHWDVDQVVIEHLLLLNNEASLRSTVDFWASHQHKHIFLLIVDMSDPRCTDRVNFIRAIVEQKGADLLGKALILLLHYPPSASHCNSCYPALLLGGWQHTFLDGVGHRAQSLKLNQCIEAACRQVDGNKAASADIGLIVSDLLPRALTYAASQSVFYPGQVDIALQSSAHEERAVFSDRYGMLATLMDKVLGENTVGDILCEKFSQMWTDQTLLKTLTRASDGLLNGTTQLSMSLSLRSMLQETLGIFITAIIAEMNNWRNLDIIWNCHCGSVTDELFGDILRALPVAPFEELMLHRHMIGGVQAIPSLATKHGPSSVQFPFFYLVSSFLDKVVEIAEESLGIETSFIHRGEHHQAVVREEDLLKRAMQVLQSDASDNHGILTQRSLLVKDVIEAVRGSCDGTPASLFQRYLSQHVQWKLGCEPKTYVIEWMLDRVSGIEGAEGNILSIHLVTTVHRLELSRLASWAQNSTDGIIFGVLCPSKALGTGRVNLIHEVVREFETSLNELPQSLSLWTSSFSAFVRRIHAIQAGEKIKDPVVVSDLRVLSFLHILATGNVSHDTMENALQRWYDKGTKRLKCSAEVSLGEFFTFLEEHASKDPSNGYSWLIDNMLRRFYSHQWLGLVGDCTKEDIVFLLNHIADGKLLGRHQLAVVLLRNACTAYCDNAIANVPHLSDDALRLLSSHIKCKNLSSFSENGQRNAVPHFVPAWMTKECGNEIASENIVENNFEFDVFFSDYVHSYSCPLADVAFDMILGILLEQAQAASSEHLLLSLLDGIEAECRIKQSDQIHSAREQSCSVNECISLIGSSVGALISDARLFSFVAKVAVELAVDSQASALQGQYADSGHGVLGSVMSLTGCQWQDFFFYNIMRVRGEGNLVMLLSEGGPLHGMPWCQEMAHGMPALRQGSEQALKKAEDLLADALREEERKCQELRRCPSESCGRLFSILERRCGRFVCGRDAHGNIGNDGVYGCGYEFNVDQAPRYSTDETILAPLRAAVAEEQACLRMSNIGAMQLERVKSMQVPFLLHWLEKMVPTPIVPASILYDELGTTASATLSAPVESLGVVMKTLSEEHTNIKCYSHLPYLIEFYMWIHSTFRFLVTRQQAMEMKMSELMNAAVLQRRFDRITTRHVLKLWRQTVHAFDFFLEMASNQVLWECEEVEIPFSKVKDTCLMMLLSEDDHPTGGHDYLFLVINDIVNRYNSFSRRLNQHSAQLHNNRKESNTAYELHPKFLLCGSSGALSINGLDSNSIANLASLAESFWNAEQRSHDLDGLALYLKEEIGLPDDCPVILNPTTFLRERFHFRDEKSANLEVDGDQAAAISSEGDYFVHVQDLQLFEDARKRLLKLSPSEGDAKIRHVISVNFHDSDYDHLRCTLEGIRTALGLISTDACKHGMTFGEALLENNAMDTLAFSHLKDTQSQFLSSLDMCQMFEMVKFLGYQLASESYLFSALPLSMADPISIEHCEEIKTGFARLCKDGAQRAVDWLDEFLRDVLSFYEAQIREASSTNQKLRMFLEKNNFCDSGCFPFFALLPTGVTVRNYIPLRQCLHQLKLAALSKQGTGVESGDEGVKTRDNHASLIQPRRGQCWLWSEKEHSSDHSADVEMEDVENQPDASNYEGLWFEDAAVKRPSLTFDEHSSMSVESAKSQEEDAKTIRLCKKRKVTSLDEDSAATALQLWWQNQTRRRSKKHPGTTMNSRVASLPSSPQAHQEYGAPGSLELMREWLNKSRLPGSLADHLTSLGARNIEDVALLVNSYPEILCDIAPLDRLKLESAVKALVKTGHLFQV